MQPTSADPLAGLSAAEARQLVRSGIEAGKVTPEQAVALMRHWPIWRRPNQIWPARKVRGVLDRKGRGGGKTRRGAEECWIRGRAREPGIILVGRTLDEVRQVMIDGPSGLRACARPGEWVDAAINSTVGKLMPYGVPIYLRSDQEPDKIRGINAAFAWIDEWAAYRRAALVLMNVEFAVRLGRAEWLITTTPRPTKFIREAIARADVHVDSGSMYENAEFLAPEFVASVERIYKGTPWEAQELRGEVIELVDGALWRSEWIDDNRVPEDTRGFSRVVVAFDPSASNSTDADEHGIVIAGSGRGAMASHLYVLDDLSGRMQVDKAAAVAVDAAIEWRCDLVYEGNNGGEWVRLTLQSVLAERVAKARAKGRDVPTVQIHSVTAKASKEARAFPLAVEYKNGMAHHLGELPDLEAQMTTWVPSRRHAEGVERSPGRIDALVWAWYHLTGTRTGSWTDAADLLTPTRRSRDL